MSHKPEWRTEWIDSKEELQRLSTRIASEEIISLDTETVGWDTGHERLCLVQIGLPSVASVAIVDVLAVSDLSELSSPLSSPMPLMVAHNASFEERQFAKYGIKLRGLVDTLDLAKNLRPDLPNHTLKTCVKVLLDYDISKDEQVSDWSRRPLTQSQLDYAALDAEIVLKLYFVLSEMQSKLELDPDLSVSELMSLMSSTVKERLEITKEIGMQLALLNAREGMIRESIRNKLIEGEPPYDGDYGRCSVTRAKRTEVSPEKVRNIMPSIASLVISDHVDRKRLQSVMEEHGIPETKLNEVLDIIGYTDRLNLSLKNIL